MAVEPNATLEEILGELEAGVFVTKIENALRRVSEGVINTGKQGIVQITLTLDQLSDSDLVNVKHALKHTKPTANGKATEENTLTTMMYVGKGGNLSISPQMQNDIFAEENKGNKITLIGAKK